MVPTRIFLIRHADVENPRRLLYGHLDGFQLSALGRAQALAVGDRLRSADLKRIVHSPLARAVETAELINSRLAMPAILEADPELREAEFSRYLQGLPYWQIPVRRPLWFVHKARRGLLPGDEAIANLGGRVLSVMKRLAVEHPGETMAIVSHADPLQAAWTLLTDALTTSGSCTARWWTGPACSRSTSRATNLSPGSTSLRQRFPTRRAP